jgi:hypothetical protein
VRAAPRHTGECEFADSSGVRVNETPAHLISGRSDPANSVPLSGGSQCYRYGPALISRDHTGQFYELQLNGLPGSPHKGLGDLALVHWVVDRWCEAKGIARDNGGGL